MKINLDPAAVAQRQADAELCDHLTEVLTERFTDGSQFAGMRTKVKSPAAWPGRREVSPHDVSLALMELLTSRHGTVRKNGTAAS